MKFGEALEEVKKGALIARAGWNGKGMFVFQRPEDMKDANDNIVNGWLASQSDILDDDWMVVG